MTVVPNSVWQAFLEFDQAFSPVQYELIRRAMIACAPPSIAK